MMKITTVYLDDHTIERCKALGIKISPFVEHALRAEIERLTILTCKHCGLAFPRKGWIRTNWTCPQCNVRWCESVRNATV